jgi:hypothetical protein
MILFYPPNVLALSRVDDCAGLGSVYFNRRQRTYQRRHQAEGHVGCKRWLLECNRLLQYLPQAKAGGHGRCAILFTIR